ncbi:MAG: SulP family inorganic anion transporter [Chitinophagaceae bacterium]|nr:SulP family inorganic anion transporter [Chitinophagaceae bacterium]MBK9463323.1 SulP family inorganic anion transporter [Chitinophagaceae bacterium]MBK9659548.1 SulP family inorganic anion transporter [Chitinophagaceae bacterium]
MSVFNRRAKFYFLSFLKHDFKASITVFFVALPLCLGISLASNAPLYSGLISGILGGIVVGFISKSHISVSGPAAGLTAICASAITELGTIDIFFLSVAVAGLIQVLLGIFRLGGFTHFIPSTVIKGMLAAIGIILMAKQVPLLLGYDKADFWTKELFNIISFDNTFQHVKNIYYHSSKGAILIALLSLALLIAWKNTLAKKITFLPTSFVVVAFGIAMALLFKEFIPTLALKDSQFVNIPENLFGEIKLPNYQALFSQTAIWKNAVIICIVASLETLLSIEAVDKLDPYNRITPQNRELVAQGTGNILSGLLGGLPITAVIVRSSANAEAGARTKVSGIFHGLWVFVFAFFLASLLNYIPYCVLAVILIRTGYNLAKPRMIRSVYKLGREQFMPFIVTVIAILFTDLLIGVGIGIAYAGYFIFKNTYKAGFTLDTRTEGITKHYDFRLAINVSFINKKKLKDELEKIPDHAVVHIDGEDSVYIDYDVIEAINEFKAKAHHKHIRLQLTGIPDVETISPH